jgi:hypothetical protein
MARIFLDRPVGTLSGQRRHKGALWAGRFERPDRGGRKEAAGVSGRGPLLATDHFAVERERDIRVAPVGLTPLAPTNVPESPISTLTQAALSCRFVRLCDAR